MQKYFYPAWKVNSDIKAVTVLRHGDIRKLGCPDITPKSLTQVHGARVLNAEIAYDNYEADAWVGVLTDKVLMIRTADCLPVFFCNSQGTKIGIAHAGWRGLAKGILEATVKALDEAPENIVVAFGPAIGQGAFEIKQDVIDAFSDLDNSWYQETKGKYYADIYRIATMKLQKLNIFNITSCDACTYSEPAMYHSYRRDKEQAGRMQSLIWVK